jgi:hypothetical protein
MKKVMLLVLLLGVLFPIQSFAYEGGLLNGKSLSLSRNGALSSVATTNTMTDNDFSTSFTLNGGYYTTAFYSFSEPILLTSYRLNSTGPVPKIGVVYEGETNKTLVSSTSTNVNGQKTSLNITKKVSKIYLENTASLGTVDDYKSVITEFDVFSDVPPPADVTGFKIASSSSTALTLSWNPYTGDDFYSYTIYKNSNKLSTYTDITKTSVALSYTNGDVFTIKVTVKGGLESNGVSVTANYIDPTKVPPGAPRTLSVSDITQTSAKVNFTNASDEDLDKTNIYLDGKKVGSVDSTTLEYSLKDLSADTSYSLGVSHTDVDGNEGNKITTTFRTKAVDMNITTPDTLQVKAMNSALSLTWKKPDNSFFVGMNVYVDGQKLNSDPVKNTGMFIKDLENDRDYSVRISGVYKGGEESEKSSAIVGTPKGNAIPLTALDYSLKDVATSTSGTFGGLWLIVAFAVAIPLAFLVGGRLKDLFVK